MNWTNELLNRLAQRPVCGYEANGPASTEPTALCALALLAHGHGEESKVATGWLAGLQADDGSVGVRAGEPTPRWPTSLAILAWRAAGGAYAPHVQRAVQWTLSLRGKTLPRNADLGHNTLLAAWPWVEGTHAWVEPTALHVLALKAAGYGEHLRTREAVRMLIDRLLPSGGCNYGNTVVLGQTLRPHVQPTGMAMLALAGEHDFDGRIEQSLIYLERHLSALTTTTSLCWALLGLAAHARRPQESVHWLEEAYGRTRQRGSSPYKCALLALAACDECPFPTASFPAS